MGRSYSPDRGNDALRYAEEQARRHAEEQAHRLAEELEKVRCEAEEQACRHAEELEKVRREAEEQARLHAEELEQVRRHAEELEKARRMADELGKARREAEEQARRHAEELANQSEATTEALLHQQAAEVREREARARIEEQEERARESEAKLVQQVEAAQREAERLRVREAEAQEKKEKFKQDLALGVEPELGIPTLEDIARVKATVRYDERKLHFAICGTAGSGKSSLINALRGITDHHRAAAKTGIVETTNVIGRYPDPAKDLPRSAFVWFDIPGAGTISIPGWQYFKNQGLYVFDFVVVLMDNRFTQTEVEILKNCHSLRIPSFIVRSKADQHIENIEKARKAAGEEDEDEDEDEDEVKVEVDKDEEDGVNIDLEAARYALLTPRKQFIQQTRESVTKNLHAANLPPQEVYIVSKDGLRCLMKPRNAIASLLAGSLPASAIDEKKLINDMMVVVKERRFRTALNLA